MRQIDLKKNWDIPNDQWKYEQDDINFVSQLMVPGTYKVGGLGACTLIKFISFIKRGFIFINR